MGGGWGGGGLRGRMSLVSETSIENTFKQFVIHFNRILLFWNSNKTIYSFENKRFCTIKQKISKEILKTQRVS